MNKKFICVFIIILFSACGEKKETVESFNALETETNYTQVHDESVMFFAPEDTNLFEENFILDNFAFDLFQGDSNAVSSRDENSSTSPVAEDDSALIAVLELIGGDSYWGAEWVDGAFYDSPTIDESVVFPVGIVVMPTIPDYSNDTQMLMGISFSLFGEPTIRHFHDFERTFRPLTMIEPEAGVFELRYDFSRDVTGICGNHWKMPWQEDDERYFENHKIIIDTRNLPVQTIRYYIGETGYDLIRFDENRDPSRYTFEAVDAGIRLAWQLPAAAFYCSDEMRLYRSTVRGERGELIREKNLESYEWLREPAWTYEFIDTNVNADETYFYSLWITDYWNSEENPVLIGGERQMFVGNEYD
ncbi:MAG: hypothetical protein LBI27_01025 [Clostridiales bacterium]|jgi:hypothetical protein|nr:hypothetical protein [Clostridiales bacterium]